jgi:3-deoxy-manno-octulosonate cytidylyltransferase (CMP-KDO synthetase)
MTECRPITNIWAFTGFVSLPEGEWERFEKLEQLRALEYGYNIRVVLTEHDSIEVDTERDLLRVEELLGNNYTE